MKSNVMKNLLAIWGGVCAIGLMVQKYKEHEELHKDTKCMGMIWKDDNDILYNSKGEQIGRVWMGPTNES